MTTIFVLALIGALVFYYFRQQHCAQMLEQERAAGKQLAEEKRIIFNFLHDLGEAFDEHIDKNQLLNVIIECAARVTHARSGIIYLRHKGDNTRPDTLHAAAVHGIFPPPFPVPGEEEKNLVSRFLQLEALLKDTPLDLGGATLIAQSCRTATPARYNGDELKGRRIRFSEADLHLNSLILLPLQYRGDILGIMALANSSWEHFSENDFEVAKSMADQAAFSLYNANIYAQLGEKQRMERDLQTASDIQRFLLPDSRPSIHGYEIEAVNHAAMHVSGDYYDFFQVDDSRLGIVIADVSGKGISASLVMAMCRTVLRTHAPGNPSPSEVLRRTNRVLHPDLGSDLFITLSYMILNHRTHTLTLAKAGHDAPLLYEAASRAVRPLQSPGMAVGIDSGDLFDTVIADLELQLQPGDLVLVNTDGINEAIDANGAEFGRDAITAALNETAHCGAGALVRDLVGRVVSFRGDELQNDDITLVALQRQ